MNHRESENHNQKTIAIITARGGSKRIPRKNIRDFCGKPIIAYSIQTARDSGLFDLVMVSTDDEEIATIAREYGAEVPFLRSSRTSDDQSTTEDALLEVLDRYEELGLRFDIMCNLYPTAPLITADRLREAYELLMSEECNTVFPVVQFSFPPQRGLIMKDGYVLPVKHADYMKRSQDLCPILHDSGQFYFFRTESFRKTGSSVDKAKPIIVSEMEVQDIDTLTDWKLAELKYQMLKSAELQK
ncbi:MAG: pseudaminic acid cytidylyltransferase [Lachnospiraceae bacterium]|nr:pseudaminic acid cytidylyltransferase [Lachnospiraceae bacterium]